MKKKLLILLCSFFCLSANSQAPTNGLVAYWPFDGNFNDSGSNAINGTNFSSTFTSNVFAESNKAVTFSNPNPNFYIVNQYGSHPNNANLNFMLNQDFSIDFNFLISSPYVHSGGFYDYGINTYSYGVWFWNANGFLQLQFNFGNASIGTTDGAIAYDTWKHVTAVKTGDLLKIYIDGQLNATGNCGTTVPNYTSTVGRFGSMYFSSISPPQYNGCNGSLDELRIYNRALTDNEILSLYQFNSLDNTDFNTQNNSLVFYPNPSKGKINFNRAITNIEIYDINGKQMKVDLNEESVDVSNLAKGIYLIKIIDLNGETLIDKLIKE